jgi:hypothetical protein
MVLTLSTPHSAPVVFSLPSSIVMTTTPLRFNMSSDGYQQKYSQYAGQGYLYFAKTLSGQ